MANIGQDLKTNVSELAVCFNCGEEFTAGKGLSYHQRKCVDLPHTNFIQNAESLIRTVHVGDIILCFKKDAQRSTDWFKVNWGNHFSISTLKKNIGAKAKNSKRVQNPGISFSVLEFKKLADAPGILLKGDSDECDSLFKLPIVQECLDSLEWCIDHGYKTYFYMIFQNDKIEFIAPKQNKIKEEEIQTIEAPVENINFHTHPEIDTICLSVDQYEALKQTNMIDEFKNKYKAGNINIDMMT